MYIYIDIIYLYIYIFIYICRFWIDLICNRLDYNYQCHVEVYLRYVILRLYWEHETIMLEIIQAPTVLGWSVDLIKSI